MTILTMMIIIIILIMIIILITTAQEVSLPCPPRKKQQKATSRESLLRLGPGDVQLADGRGAGHEGEVPDSAPIPLCWRGGGICFWFKFVFSLLWMDEIQTTVQKP